MQRPIDILQIALSDTSNDYSKAYSESVKTAPTQQCKDAISLVKRSIKNKKVLPTQKLVALKLLHSGMMVANTNYLLFACKKVSRRFLILGRFNKHTKSPDRGLGIFGSQTGEQAVASIAFLNCLLSFIKQWARSFGLGPDRNPSDFYKLYNTLYREGVSFPPSSSIPAKPDSRPQQQAEARQSKPATEKPAQVSGKSQVTQLDQCRDAVKLATEMMRSGEASVEILSELIQELKLMKKSLENEVQDALTSGSSARVTALIDANENIQACFDRFELHRRRPQAREKPKESKAESADILGFEDAPQRPDSAEAFNTYAPGARLGRPVPPAFDTSRKSQLAAPNAFATQPRSEESKDSASDFDFSSMHGGEFASMRQSMNSSFDPRQSLGFEPRESLSSFDFVTCT